VEQIRSEMKTEQQLKGVCVTVAGLSVHISSMLERLTYGFEEIPFFGTMADVYYVSERALEPFIFDDERSYLRGVIILLYSGEELHIDAEYIFGWKPIGKSMSIIPSEHEVTIGDTAVSMIDDMTPETVYNKYLGIGFDNYLTINSCQFPLVIERDGLLIGRTPASISEDGEVLFIGSIRPEEKVRFSYTVRNDLLYNTEKRSLDLYDFAPQAVELFICGNRSIMLRKDSNLELECFRRFAPDTLHCSAAGEIYYHHGRGEFLNSALVAVGMREGDKQELAAGDISGELIPERQEGIIPLSERILNFLQAMSGDLMDYARDAQRASKAKSAFLAGMSHEIRTPINAVLGMNEMILREADDQEILSYASDIDQAGHTLLSLINDILDVSKIEEGRMEILPTEYELSSVIGDLVNMIRERAEKKHLELKVDVDGSIPHLLYGDEIRIKQIILNLLTNAVKYTEEGEVRFSIAHEQTAEKEILLKVTVADTGIGMKEEDLDRLFSPFARIEEKRNRSIEGTGLGMSIVKQLLALMDSRLEVQSVYGKGSEFSFVIRQRVVKWEPIGDFSARYAVANEKREEYHELFRAPAARILVVDDTEVNLTVMKNLLKRTEIRIDTALSGKEALQMIRDHTYDVVFIDHMMPDMDGIETLEHIRNITDSIPVCIALTANAVSGAREMYLEAGFADYLSKPIDGKRLELMLKRYLPKDKLVETDQTAGNDRALFGKNEPVSDAEMDMPSWISEIPELHTELGIHNCGSIESYLSVLRTFHQTADSKADEIEKLYNERDLVNYTIKVHALKSSARIIGADALSDLAKELEAAGKSGKEDIIHDNTGILLRMYRDLNARLSLLDGEKKDRKLLTEELRKDALQTMSEIVDSMDFGLMEGILQDLHNYWLSPEDEGLIQRIEELLMELNWEGINREIDAVLNRI